MIILRNLAMNILRTAVTFIGCKEFIKTILNSMLAEVKIWEKHIVLTLLCIGFIHFVFAMNKYYSLRWSAHLKPIEIGF